MGLIDGLMGNASEVDVAEIQQEFAPIMGEGESVQLAYKEIRDLYLFTNRRLILVDKQGVTSKRTVYLSIPYKSISHFSVETNGHFDLDAELKIWLANLAEPITRDLKKGKDVVAIQKTLATYIV